jgi:hypothetical protein
MRCNWMLLNMMATVGFWASSCVAQTENVTELVDGKVEQLAKGFKFTEGPAADDHGNVYLRISPTSTFLSGPSAAS